MFYGNLKKVGGSKKAFAKFLVIITLAIMLFISGYMSVNVAKFYLEYEREMNVNVQINGKSISYILKEYLIVFIF